MARDDIQVNVRLPAELKKQLDDAAARAGRSLTAEVVARLSDSFRDIERVMLENRERELALLEAEMEQVRHQLTMRAAVTDRSDPEFQERIRYYERLDRYRELVTGGMHWIRDARHPIDGGEPAEVHEFPTGKRSAR